jgi:hypothetical protein
MRQSSLIAELGGLDIVCIATMKACLAKVLRKRMARVLDLGRRLSRFDVPNRRMVGAAPLTVEMAAKLRSQWGKNARHCGCSFSF